MQNTVTEADAGALIRSDQVNGTEVYALKGDHVGTIDHLLIDRESGRIAYAVMTFGGFLGMGEDSYPIPWGKLKYDTSLGGYRTDIERDQLAGAPERPENWYEDRAWQKSTYDHFGVPGFWL